MIKPIIAGNWKMFKTTVEARELVRQLKAALADVDSVEIVVSPPFTALATVAGELKGSNISVAVQNMYWEESGAFTGEVSPLMLKDIGCTHVIIGHSERRQFFNETDATVNKKVKAALKAGLTPIACVGETLAERESGAKGGRRRWRLFAGCPEGPFEWQGTGGSAPGEGPPDRFGSLRGHLLA